MNREKKKSESTLQGKQGVIRTQKVSLCLVPSKHFNSNHKAASFCQNLNIKSKTTKSSPEKTIIKDQNYNNPSKNQNDSNMNSINKEIEKISDDFMKRKLIKKQIETKGKINRLNFTNPKFISALNSNPQINSARLPNNTHKVIAQHRLLSPFNDNSNSNNSNINSSSLNNYHKPANSISIQNDKSNITITHNQNSNSKQKNKTSQTTPGTNQNSRKTSREKILLYQSNNIEGKIEPKRLYNNKKNSILTNITRNSEKKRKNNSNTLVSSINTSRSNYSSSSHDKILLIQPTQSMNITNIILSSSNSMSKPHLTSGNSPKYQKMKFRQNSNIHNSNKKKSSVTDRTKHNSSLLKRETEQISNKNNISSKCSTNIKNVMYNLKGNGIKKNHFTTANSKETILYGSVMTSNTANKVTVISKSTSNSVSKRATSNKVSSSNINAKNKKVSIPNTKPKSISKTNKKVINNQSSTNRNVNTNNEISFLLSNQSVSSMKSVLIKEGTYYQMESEKVSNYIKNYYKKYRTYPKTTVSFYKFGRIIGRGAFGKVNLGLHILTGRIVAIKSFNKSRLESESAKEKIYHEVNLMKNLRHNSIVKILETVETEKYILIIMENVSGGDLLSFVKKRTKLNEKTAKIIFKQLILAIKYIHSRNIIHRDIKLDNILIDLNNNIKLCDFGVGKQIHKGELLNDQCGTPAYIAPEIVRNDSYEGPPVDLWSSGVVLYAMLSGTFPFKASNIKELNRIIQKGECPMINKVSIEGMSLIKGLLECDPKKRLTVDKVLNHPWLNNGSISEDDKCSLFTNAELVLLSKANIDYRVSAKEDIIENFTIKNLDTANVTNNQNVATKSLILAPFNSSIDDYDNDTDSEAMLKIENNAVKFNDNANILNRNYELNNNGEIDHGILINHSEKIDIEANQKESESTINNIDDEIAISPPGEKKKIVDSDFSSNKNSQRNFTSLTNSSTQLIDEGILKMLEGLGFDKEYLQRSLTNNELNYGTAGYFLLSNVNDFPY